VLSAAVAAVVQRRAAVLAADLALLALVEAVVLALAVGLVAGVVWLVELATRAVEDTAPVSQCPKMG
jgi:hypothetical protein